MTFGGYESSRYSGQPINLYLFRYGDAPTNYYAYTDAESEVTFGNDDAGNPVVYLPIAIDRGKIASSGTLDKSNLTISTPHNTDLARLYLSYPPSSVTTLVMYQGHIDDVSADFKVVWGGRVIACARKGSKADFTCEPISTALRRNGLRRRYQFGCPLVLYGADCAASKSAATTAATVASVNGAQITLPTGWEGQYRAAKYLQGLAEWINPSGAREIRTILRIENGGRRFLLSGPAFGLSAGSTVNMVLGCNHKSGTNAQPDGDCGPLHNNVQNFGGQEYIPFKSPIGLVNSFY